MLKCRSPKREHIILNEDKEKERLNMDIFGIGLLVIGNVCFSFTVRSLQNIKFVFKFLKNLHQLTQHRCTK